MGTINNYYFHRVIIRRLVDTALGKNHYVATGTVDVHLQRADDRNGAIDAQMYGATHRLWCDISTDIQDGDIVFDDEGTRYLVVAVRIDGVDWAINQHQEVILRKYND
jgi:hypothetical protein